MRKHTLAICLLLLSAGFFTTTANAATTDKSGDGSGIGGTGAKPGGGGIGGTGRNGDEILPERVELPERIERPELERIERPDFDRPGTDSLTPDVIVEPPTPPDTPK